MGRTKGAKGKKNKKVFMNLQLISVEGFASEQTEVDKIKITPEVVEDKTQLTKEQEERREKLKDVMRDLNKNLGKDSVNFADTMEVRERIPFKQKCITNFTGGGVVRGLHACFWGSKSCGKSTVVLDLIAKAQELGCICVYINGEQSYDPIYAAKRGVDTKTLVVENVKKLEDGLDTMIRLCKENVVDLIVFDSIHGLAPKAELVAGKGEKDKSTSDSNMALRARALTQYFEMGVAEVSKAKCAVVLIAQSRMDLGSFVKIETLTGGHALLHNCRLIIRFRRGQGADAPTEKRPTGTKDDKGKEKMKDVAIGFDLVMHVNKSQIEGCTEGDEIHVPFYFAEGIKE